MLRNWPDTNQPPEPSAATASTAPSAWIAARRCPSAPTMTACTGPRGFGGFGSPPQPASEQPARATASTDGSILRTPPAAPMAGKPSGAPKPAFTLAPMALRGRDGELNAVDAALDAADFGPPLLIVGQAGIGKSAL